MLPKESLLLPDGKCGRKDWIRSDISDPSLCSTIPSGIRKFIPLPDFLELWKKGREERDLISWPLFLHLLMATPGAWSQPEVSGRRLQLLIPSLGARSALPTREGTLQQAQGSFLSCSPSCCEAETAGDRGTMLAWGATPGFQFYAEHTSLLLWQELAAPLLGLQIWK